MALDLVTGYKGAAHITAEDIGAFNAGVVGSGEYVLNTGNKLSASLVSSNTVKILDGDLVIQGRHVTLKKNTFEELTIENGENGMNRSDLIVARYTKNSGTGAEDVQFVVIKGTATTGQASDPEYTVGDILSGDCTLHDMPLYRISLTGLNVAPPEALFEVIGNNMADLEGLLQRGKIPFTSIADDTPETWISLGDGIWQIPFGMTEYINGLPSSYTGTLLNTVIDDSGKKKAVQLFIATTGNAIMQRVSNALGNWSTSYSNYNQVWTRLSTTWEDQIVQGVYYGNAETESTEKVSVSQYIDLGFSPSGVIVARNGAFFENAESGNAACVAIHEYGAVGINISGAGFEVASMLNEQSVYRRKLNDYGERYTFIAWR